jgi:CRISPR system Cascade subunit CasB
MNDQTDQDILGRAWAWWAKVIREAQTGGDRASRSRLRRASPTEAMAEEATHDLFHRIYGAGRERAFRLPRVASLAGVLAHVREDDRRSLGRAAGRPRREESPAISHSRVKRLLDAREEEEIVTGMRRLVGMLGGQANIRDLARLILEIENDRVRRRFLFDYFDVPTAEDQQPQLDAQA